MATNTLLLYFQMQFCHIQKLDVLKKNAAYLNKLVYDKFINSNKPNV